MSSKKSPVEKQRLSKVLAAAGIAARRAAEELIFAGKVTVNGKVTRVPQTMVSLDEDDIVVEGEKVRSLERKKCYILNKPKGYICSSERPRPTSHIVLDLFQDCPERLFTVGRLDKDTTGLILVTNDGHLANKVIHPSSNIEKEYIAKTNAEITPEHLKRIFAGTWVDGIFVKPLIVKKIRRGTLKIVVHEGKKREVRRLLEVAGLEALVLTRTRIGNLRLGNLAEGQWRELTESDKELIFE